MVKRVESADVEGVERDRKGLQWAEKPEKTCISLY